MSGPAQMPRDIFDMFAAPPTEGGRDDPYWQTEEGSRLFAHMQAVEIDLAQKRADEVARLSAEREAEQEARDVERQATQRAALAEKAERDAAEAQAKAEQEARWRSEVAEIEAAGKAGAAARDAFVAALEKRDDDHHALQVYLGIRIEGASLEGEPLEEDHDLDLWDLDEDEATNARMIDDLKAAITAAIEPWVPHFQSLGLIRADFINFEAGGKPGSEQTGPTFFLVHKADDVDLSPETLANFAPVVIDLPQPAGATLTLTAWGNPVNATMLYDAMSRGAIGVGQWGGEATPDMAPTPDESRSDWLARVSVPRDRLARMIMRWAASGHELCVFRAYGDFTERDTGNSPTAWTVDGVLARGVITLLAGDSTAGKTSLVHEWCAALGGQGGARPRTVLGQEVTGRFECAFITGEGDAGMDFKRSTAHARAWGRSTYAKFNASARPLPEILLALRRMPVLDLLVIDPMRAFLSGDEKSSDTINEFYKPLEKFCEEMNCALVVTQHFTKSGQKGRALDDMKSIVRGSGTIVERPRMVIVMDRLRDGTIRIAPAKHNLAEEELWVRSSQWSLWRRDLDTHTLVPLDGAASSSTDNGSLLALVYDAIAEQNEISVTLRRTGEHELFEQKLPSLEGLSRSKIRAAVAALVDDGRVEYGTGGLIVVPPERRTMERG